MIFISEDYFGYLIISYFLIFVFFIKSVCLCPLNRIWSPLKFVKRKLKLGLSSGDYDSAKRNFESDYHKTNPADVNHKSIIKRNHKSNSKELVPEKDYNLTLVTQNVLNYANNLKRDPVFIHEEIDEKTDDKTEKRVRDL